MHTTESIDESMKVALTPRQPVWPVIFMLATLTPITLAHRDTFGFESMITIEVLLLALIGVFAMLRRREDRLVALLEEIVAYNKTPGSDAPTQHAG